MSTITIAGGTGLIGRALEELFSREGFKVLILTRNVRKDNHVYWDPSKKEIDSEKIKQTDVLINLSGEGIADKPWSSKRKNELLVSRKGTNEFLFERSGELVDLKMFISASGVNCYGYGWDSKEHVEEDPYGDDFLSVLVKKWEESADLFSSKCKVAKIRTSVVLDRNGGALDKLVKPIKWGLGAPLGTGKQAMPWIHIEDLAGIYLHVIRHELSGTFNAVTGNESNRTMTREIAAVLQKILFLPPVPAFMLKMYFGEMAEILLENVVVSNEKIRSKGYIFKYPDLKSALENILISS